MIESKLFQLLRTLSAEEFKDFRKLAASPFFNREGDYILRFVDNLKKYHPALSDPALKKEKIFKKLYPEKNYDDVIIRKMSSVTQKLAEEFLVQKGLSNKEYEKDFLLINQLTLRGLGDMFEKKYASLSKEIYSTATVNEDFFHTVYQFERNVYNYYLTHPKHHLASEHHIKYGGYLIMDTIVKGLNLRQDLSISRTSHNQFLDKQLVEAFLESFNMENMLSFIKDTDLKEKYILDIFYYASKAHADVNDDEVYFRLKDIVLKNFGRFDKGFRIKTLTFFLNNICTEKIRHGKRDFYYEIFDNYKFMLKHQLYINPGNNYFHLSIYRAILITAASINELDWLEEFVEKYKDTLQPDLRENLVNYSYGYINFYRRNYEKALIFFNKVTFDTFLFKLDVKNYQLMMFYSLGYVEEALALIDTYKHFISDNKLLSANLHDIVANFIRFVSAMIKIKWSNGTKEDAEILKIKIEETAIVGFKMWLLEKIDELIKEMK